MIGYLDERWVDHTYIQTHHCKENLSGVCSTAKQTTEILWRVYINRQSTVYYQIPIIYWSLVIRESL